MVVMVDDLGWFKGESSGKIHHPENGKINYCISIGHGFNSYGSYGLTTWTIWESEDWIFLMLWRRDNWLWLILWFGKTIPSFGFGSIHGDFLSFLKPPKTKMGKEAIFAHQSSDFTTDRHCPFAKKAGRCCNYCMFISGKDKQKIL